MLLDAPPRLCLKVNEEPLAGSFHESLKSGVVLCRSCYGIWWPATGKCVTNMNTAHRRLINNLHPKTVKRINKTKMEFKQRENINNVIMPLIT